MSNICYTYLKTQTKPKKRVPFSILLEQVEENVLKYDRLRHSHTYSS